MKDKELLEEEGPFGTEKTKEAKAQEIEGDARITELEDLLKRVQADFENFRKQNEKDRRELVQKANASLLLKLLPVLDELEHTITEAKRHGNGEVALLEVMHKNLLKVLSEEGVRDMKCDKEKFDPYLHDAIKQEESDVSEGHISTVVRKGYYIHDKVLRHALVIVSKGKK